MQTKKEREIHYKPTRVTENLVKYQILPKMLSNQNSHALLAGKQNSIPSWKTG